MRTPSVLTETSDNMARVILEEGRITNSAREGHWTEVFEGRELSSDALQCSKCLPSQSAN
jgi:hypothetical protein